MKFHRDGTLPVNNEYFVFGSNLAGIHGAGAAKAALKFGATYGVGNGFCGNTYAIPTKSREIGTLSLEAIDKYIALFIDRAYQLRDTKQFFVTRIGCGLAGYRDADIAPLFRDRGGYKTLHNCSFAEEWSMYLPS